MFFRSGCQVMDTIQGGKDCHVTDDEHVQYCTSAAR